jgi:hypothetical protein
MVKKQQYEEKYLLNKHPFDPNSEKLQVYAYFDSVWKPGYSYSWNSPYSYALYSLVLEGSIKRVNSNGDTYIYEAGNFYLSLPVSNQGASMTFGKSRCVRKCLSVYRNSFHDLIISRLFPENIAVKLVEGVYYPFIVTAPRKIAVHA